VKGINYILPLSNSNSSYRKVYYFHSLEVKIYKPNISIFRYSCILIFDFCRIRSFLDFPRSKIPSSNI